MRVLFLGITQIRERYPKNFIQSDEQRFRIVNLVGPTYIDIRINGTAFDKSGNLWVTNSRIKWIKSFENQRSMAKLCHGWNFRITK
jgi:hypothetical protein